MILAFGRFFLMIGMRGATAHQLVPSPIVDRTLWVINDDQISFDSATRPKVFI
jgi:hypothetical protein